MGKDGFAPHFSAESWSQELTPGKLIADTVFLKSRPQLDPGKTQSVPGSL